MNRSARATASGPELRLSIQGCPPGCLISVPGVFVRSALFSKRFCWFTFRARALHGHRCSLAAPHCVQWHAAATNKQHLHWFPPWGRDVHWFPPWGEHWHWFPPWGEHLHWFPPWGEHWHWFTPWGEHLHWFPPSQQGHNQTTLVSQPRQLREQPAAACEPRCL